MKLERPKNLKIIIIIACFSVFLLAIIFLMLVYTRELSEIEAEITYRQEEKSLSLVGIGAPDGQIAVGSSNEVKAIYGGDKSAPIASLTKVITSAVAMEQAEDLNKIITLDEIDISYYEKAVWENGSRLQVEVGEQLSLRQMHEALFVVSANNIADSLVYHLFGTHENYKAKAEEWLEKNGLKNTTIGIDASGLDSSTTSTPSDMIKIGQIILENPEIRQMAKTKVADFPLEGEIENTNELLKDGYFGIKTGNTDEAGSCLLFATEHESEIVIGILMGQPFNSTFDTARMLVNKVQESFSDVYIPAGTVVGEYNLPWNKEKDLIVTTQDINATTWGNAEIDIEISPYRQNFYGGAVGTLKLADKETNLVLKSDISTPSLFWRISHLNQLKW